MGRHKKMVYAVPSKPPVRLRKEPVAMLPNGREIVSGEIVKISGEYGGIFRFDFLVTNEDTGVQWIDCRELHKGQIGQFRSFYLDRVKKVPTKRKKRSVNRTTDS